MSLVRDTALNAAASAITVITRTLAMAILARKLGVDGFGVYALALFCVEVTVRLVLLGLPGSVTRFLPTVGNDEGSRFRRIVVVWAGVSIVALGLVAGPLALLAVGVEGPAALAFAVWAVAAALGAVATAWLQGALRYDLAACSSIGDSLVVLGGITLLVVEGNPAIAFLVMAAGQIVPILTLSQLRVHQTTSDGAPLQSLPPTRTILAYGLNASIGMIAGALLWNRGELFALRHIVLDSELGLYSAAIVLVGLAWRANTLLTGAMAPRLSRCIADGDAARTEDFVEQFARLTLAATFPAAALLSLMSPELLGVVFGEDYVAAGGIVAGLAPGVMALSVGTASLATQYMSNGRLQRNMLPIAAALLVTAASAGAAIAGIEAAALARSALMLAVAAATLAWLRPRGHARLAKLMLRWLAQTTTMVIVLSAFAIHVEPPLVLRAGLVVVLTYLSVAWAGGTLVPWRLPHAVLARFPQD